MESYIHTVQYYETDKMGITHHSNYIRWMEEARVDFLDKLGFSYFKLEEDGIMSPVININCSYKKSTAFGDKVEIAVSIKEFKGVKLVIGYHMTNQKGEFVCEGESVHCFLDESGKIVKLKSQCPLFYDAIMSQITK